MKISRLFIIIAALTVVTGFFSSCGPTPEPVVPEPVKQEPADSNLIVLNPTRFIYNANLLYGSDYIILKAGQSTVDFLGDRVALDLRPNGTNINLETWSRKLSYVEADGLDAFGFDDDWQPFEENEDDWSGQGLFVDNEESGNELETLASMIGGHENEYTLVVVVKADMGANFPWTIFCGFSDKDYYTLDLTSCPNDGDWHAVTVNCADMGRMTEDNLRIPKSEGGTTIPGEYQKACSLYGIGVSNATAHCCAIFYAKFPDNP